MLANKGVTVLHDFIEQYQIDRIKDEIAYELNSFGRYDNPFEKKSFLESALIPKLPYVYNVLQQLISESTCWWISRVLDVPIDHGDISHYGGVFVYNKNDYLRPHVDAGVHPKKHQHKVATALVYITEAVFSTWHGASCTTQYLPAVYGRVDKDMCPGDLAIFANNDWAWHGVPVVRTDNRIVITASYLAPPEFNDPKYLNDRTRALFARELGEPNNPELDKLRLERASEEGHERVYRII